MTRRILDAGSLATLRAGAVRVVRCDETTPGGRDREVLVMRTAHGIRAYENLCRHLPVPLDAGGRRLLATDGRHLLCGTHGALYRPEDGFCVSGPCEGDALHAHEATVEHGRILVALDDVGDD